MFKFAGSGSNPRYAFYLYTMFCNLEFEFPAALRKALFNNWLLNPSGLPGHFQGADLSQEHLIGKLDDHTQHTDHTYQSHFIREIVAPNVDSLLYVPRQMEESLGLNHRSMKHTEMHTRPEAQVLAKLYRDADLHRFYPGRKADFVARDDVTRGYHAFQEKLLKKYQEWHRRGTNILSRPRRDGATAAAYTEDNEPQAPGAEEEDDYQYLDEGSDDELAIADPDSRVQIRMVNGRMEFEDTGNNDGEISDELLGIDDTDEDESHVSDSDTNE